MRIPAPWHVVALIGTFAADAHAGAAVGIAFDADLNRAGAAVGEVDVRNGLGLRVPVRVPLGEGAAAIRITAGARVAPGSDRVAWDDEGVRVYSEVSDAAFAAGELRVGPELMPGQGALRPYAGVEAGLVWAWSFHALEGAAASSLLPSGGADGLNPYSRQISPSAGLHGGLRYSASESFALELEAGYNFSFQQEVELQNAPAGLAATRTPYGWSVIRVGLGATFLLGNRTNP